MQEIIKLWKEFEVSQASKIGESSSGVGPTLEIRIPAEHITTTNRQVIQYHGAETNVFFQFQMFRYHVN